LAIVTGRGEVVCPVCWHTHCLTLAGRLWTHGPRHARCRGSRLRLVAARVVAATVRGRRVETVHLPAELPSERRPA
jgi:hypothetical protein